MDLENQLKYKTELVLRFETEAEHLRGEVDELVEAKAAWEKEKEESIQARHLQHQSETASLEQCARALEERDDIQQRHAELVMQHEEFLAQRTFDNDHVFKLNDELEESYNKIERLQAALRQSEALEEAASSERAVMARNIARLEEEIKTLKAAQEDAETSRQGQGFAMEVERTQTHAALDDSKARVEALEHLLKSSREHAESLECQLNTAIEERNDRTAELESTRGQLSSTQACLEKKEEAFSAIQTRLTDEVTALECNNAALLEELESAKQHSTNVQRELESATSKAELLGHELSLYEEQQAVDRRAIESLQESLRQVQDSLDATSQHPTVTATTQTQSDSTPNTPQRNLNAASIIVQRLRSERDAAKGDLEFLQTERTLETNQLTSMLEKLEMRVKELEQELEEAQQRLVAGATTVCHRYFRDRKYFI